MVIELLRLLAIVLLVAGLVMMKRAEVELAVLKKDLETLNGVMCKCGHSLHEHRDYEGIGNTACFYITCLCESYREMGT